jgi:glycosyltransferase involved in cell wall biosynthesis
MPMRPTTVIHIVTPHFYPEITACSHRMQSFAKTLAEKHKVRVFTLTEIGIDAPRKETIFNENIEVFYINHKQYNKRNFFVRAFFEFFYAVKLSRLSASKKADVLLTTCPFMFMIPGVYFFGGNTPKILDLRDLVWAYMKKGIIRSLFEKMAVTLIPKFNWVVCTNENESSWITTHTKQKNISVIFNGIDREKFNRITEEVTPNKKQNFTISYIGNLGIAQNMMTFVLAAEKLPEVQFLVIGDGNDKNNLETYASKHNMKNISFLGKLPWETVLKYYCKSDILYAKLAPEYGLAVPSKLYEYLSTGLPLIYGGIGEAVNLLGKFKGVHVVPPENAEDLIQAIQLVMSSEQSFYPENRELIANAYLREANNLKLNEIVGVILSGY